jgi:AraC-like DNA-binding protein
VNPSFLSYAPAGRLRNFVNGIVYIEGNGSGLALQRVYQNILINLGDNFFSGSPYTDAPIENKSLVWINGRQVSPFILENPGVTRFYVIAVKPGMLSFFCTLPVNETNDKALSFEHWTTTDMLSLRTHLLHVTHEEGFAAIEKHFTAMIADIHDPALFGHIQVISKMLPDHTVDEMCSRLQCSRKKLWTDVKKYFGASVKEMQGIIRFDQHLAAIAHHADKPLSQIHNFYDQAHFINDFKQRTGMTPKNYKALCLAFPSARHNPNFIPLTKETFLQFCKDQGI